MLYQSKFYQAQFYRQSCHSHNAFVRSALALALLAGCSAAHGAVTYTSQIRSVTAETNADMNVLTRSATNFAPFVETASLTTTIPSTTIPNRAVAGIDCQLDPNAIRATGTLAAAGGLDIMGTPTFGEASARVEIGFNLSTPTLISIFATPRPSNDPRDRYVLKLSDLNNDLLDIDQTMPAQTVNFQQLLPAGDYVFEFQVEYSLASAEDDVAFNVQAIIPTPASLALFGAGGLLAARRRR